MLDFFLELINLKILFKRFPLISQIRKSKAYYTNASAQNEESRDILLCN